MPWTTPAPSEERGSLVLSKKRSEDRPNESGHAQIHVQLLPMQTTAATRAPPEPPNAGNDRNQSCTQADAFVAQDAKDLVRISSRESQNIPIGDYQRARDGTVVGTRGVFGNPQLHATPRPQVSAPCLLQLRVGKEDRQLILGQHHSLIVQREALESWSCLTRSSHRSAYNGVRPTSSGRMRSVALC